MVARRLAGLALADGPDRVEFEKQVQGLLGYSRSAECLDLGTRDRLLIGDQHQDLHCDPRYPLLAVLRQPQGLCQLRRCTEVPAPAASNELESLPGMTID